LGLVAMQTVTSEVRAFKYVAKMKQRKQSSLDTAILLVQYCVH